MAKDREPTFFYGYVIVIAAFFIVLVMWGTAYTFGVFFEPLLTEFGWTRAATSGAFSLAFFLHGLLGVPMGWLTDRFGPRLVMTVCGVFLGSGYLLMSQISALWQLYLFYGVMVGIGFGGGFVPLLSTVARWFVRRRGMMTGFVTAGIGVGTMIMPPLARWLIASYGWRNSYSVVGVIALALIILAAQLLRRDPTQMGQLSYGEDEPVTANLDLQATGLSLREAIRTRQFWMVGAIFFCFLFCLEITMVHVVPHALELGTSATVAANVLAIIGGISIAGKIMMGSASDKIGVRLALMIGFIILIISFLWLIIAKEVVMLYLFAVIFGMAYGSVAALQPLTVAWLFGLSAHGLLFGVTNFSGTIGGSFGPSLAGYIFDIFSSYQLAFGVCTVFAGIGFMLALFLRPISRKGGEK